MKSEFVINIAVNCKTHNVDINEKKVVVKHHMTTCVIYIVALSLSRTCLYVNVIHAVADCPSNGCTDKKTWIALTDF